MARRARGGIAEGRAAARLANAPLACTFSASRRAALTMAMDRIPATLQASFSVWRSCARQEGHGVSTDRPRRSTTDRTSWTDPDARNANDRPQTPPD